MQKNPLLALKIGDGEARCINSLDLTLKANDSD